MTRRDGAEVKTKHLILTFERHTLPALVKAVYLNGRVRPYVPNTQRCFCCQRFFHGSRSCRGRETCAKCGSHDHVADVCEGSVACANCKGPHPAYSRSCPLWRQEKEILSLRAKENLSYPEAKQRFSFISKGTYSDAVRRSPAPRAESRATQFSNEDLAGPSQALKQPAGKQGAPGNAGSTQLPQSIQARPQADRQPRASGSSQDGERGRRSTPSAAARLVTEQQGPPAAPSTSKNVESVNAGGSRPGTSKPSSARSVCGRKVVAQVSDHVGIGKPASKPAARDAVVRASGGVSSSFEGVEGPFGSLRHERMTTDASGVEASSRSTISAATRPVSSGLDRAVHVLLCRPRSSAPFHPTRPASFTECLGFRAVAVASMGCQVEKQPAAEHASATSTTAAVTPPGSRPATPSTFYGVIRGKSGDKFWDVLNTPA
ncbi:hypothetical protein HPB47_014474 [Ixodes persulcatus]|uniref:Uncharacterized protein n=1 Tax=Ixodes persulcatus TaxID=34615 RepID=A0AC60QWR8_IXOPE|nr:hypothetical protein HPB47_014474 [Ixodes persulcatus]